MMSYFPKAISKNGLTVYVVSLVVVSVVFISFAIPAVWMLFGLSVVALFFILSTRFSKDWQTKSEGDYVKRLFGIAVVLRLVWVVFSFYLYKSQTGQPFEWDAADSFGYHEAAQWLASESWQHVIQYLFVQGGGISDTGYLIYLQIIYRIFGPNVLVPRLLKAVYGAFACVLLYKLSARILGEQVGRMAGIFAMLMPNLIVYCGLHLKETEMLLLVVAFLERADDVIRNRNFNLRKLIVVFLLLGSLFFFRTVLGAVAVFSFVIGVVFYPRWAVSKRRKASLFLWVFLALVAVSGGVLWNEVKGYWADRDVNQESKRLEQTSRGNQWAKYATGAVMAPMVFVLPFSTMVDTGQYNQLVMHGGNFVRNFMGIFVLISLFNALFVKKNWRNLSLIGSFLVGYFFVVANSAFGNSERFLLPGLPCLIVMWAYGVSLLNVRNFRFVKYWFVVVVAMEIGWAYFKVGSRGMLG